MECHQSENDAATDLATIHIWVCFLGKYFYEVYWMTQMKFTTLTQNDGITKFL